MAKLLLKSKITRKWDPDFYIKVSEIWKISDDMLWRRNESMKNVIKTAVKQQTLETRTTLFCLSVQRHHPCRNDWVKEERQEREREEGGVGLCMWTVDWGLVRERLRLPWASTEDSRAATKAAVATHSPIFMFGPEGSAAHQPVWEQRDDIVLRLHIYE